VDLIECLAFADCLADSISYSDNHVAMKDERGSIRDGAVAEMTGITRWAPHDHSRVTVVFVTSNTDDAYYQRQEIANAIALARLAPDSHRVAPIFMNPSPAEPVKGAAIRLAPQACVVAYIDRGASHRATKLLDLLPLAWRCTGGIRGGRRLFIELAIADVRCLANL
jgi:hypothetical protein